MLFGALRRFVTEDFKGALGAFTPCFIDVVVLGAPILCGVYIGVATYFTMSTNSAAASGHSCYRI